MSEDALKKYFLPLLEDVVFTPLSAEFTEKLGAVDVLGDADAPLLVTWFAEGKEQGVKLDALILAMARVIGADPEFAYASAYIRFIKKVCGDDAALMLFQKAAEMSKEDTEPSPCLQCAILRAASLISPGDERVVFAYAESLIAVYEDADDPEMIGAFKAEAISVLENLSIDKPEFPFVWYRLGFVYLNMGLYAKAALTWQSFLSLTAGSDSEDILARKDELSERLEQLEDPIKIEQGINDVLAGRLEAGVATLEKYTETKHVSWWPLHYYLGEAYLALGDLDLAELSYKEALALSPTETAIMERLVEIYEYCGEDELAGKYRGKIKLLKN